MIDEIDTEMRALIAYEMLKPPPSWQELDRMWDEIFREVLERDYVWTWDKDRVLGSPAGEVLN